MKLTGITDLLARLAALAPLRDASSNRRVYGLLDAAKPAILAALSEVVPGPVLVLTAHPQTAHELAQELTFWTDRSVTMFPALESLPYERVHLDRSVLSERETVVRDAASGGIDIIIAPVRALLQPVRIVRETQRSPIRVH